MGAIAGIQRAADGPIEWSYHLPHGCQLSQLVSVHDDKQSYSLFLFQLPISHLRVDLLQRSESAAGPTIGWYTGG